MKAIVYYRYGGPEVLALGSVEKPKPAANEVLVKVHAAAINPLDMHIMHGMAPVRLRMGLTKPKHPVLGADIAGTVVATGVTTMDFKVGDEVFGASASETNLGGFAEFVTVQEQFICRKPAEISFEDAAAIPIAALTALQAMRDSGHIQTGQKVLINGASGGVGTYAVQLAKSYGTQVTAICSGLNKTLVESVGADYVIDYTTTDYLKVGRTYDLIIDCIGNLPARDMKRVLNKGGRGVVLGFTSFGKMFKILLSSIYSSVFGSRKIVMMGAKVNRADLDEMAKLMLTGKVKSIIDRVVSLEEVPEAMGYIETRRARGKVVIKMTD